jgi:hypothetical protein
MTNATKAAIIEDYVWFNMTYKELAEKYKTSIGPIYQAVNAYFTKPEKPVTLQSKINDNLQPLVYIRDNWNYLNVQTIADNLGYSKRHIQSLAVSLGLGEKPRIVRDVDGPKYTKGVKDVKSGLQWQSLKQCAIDLGLHRKTLYRYLTGQRKCKKYSFEFV